MFENTLKHAGRLFEAVKDDFNHAFQATRSDVRRHRIVTQDGHIVITGEFKSITVNGVKVDIETFPRGSR